MLLRASPRRPALAWKSLTHLHPLHHPILSKFTRPTALTASMTLLHALARLDERALMWDMFKVHRKWIMNQRMAIRHGTNVWTRFRPKSTLRSGPIRSADFSRTASKASMREMVISLNLLPDPSRARAATILVPLMVGMF
jgi:hypothetical protein